MKYKIVILEVQENETGMPTIDLPDEIVQKALALEIISKGGKPCIRCLMPDKE